MYSRKDLILLHKYKDESYKRALVERVVSLTKSEVFKAAMKGETLARISSEWASSQEQLASLQKEEQVVRDQLHTAFPDAKIEVDINSISFFFFSFWEIVVKVNWS
jgi:hypothetical protein